jgi:serine/threonine-protein kinase
MGEVYAAEAPDLGRPVAVKRMLEHVAGDDDILRLFVREMMVASTLEHHNVVEVIDVGLAAGELYLVMELVDGPTLAEVLEVSKRRSVPIPIEVACGIATQVAQGLAHAHERALPDGTPLGIVHRDVAPENVLLGADGIPKVVDFGLAKLEGQSLTQPGVIRGRPRSLAPEQARGDDTDARTDIFALGAILFEMTSGDRLYPDEAVATLLWRVAAGDYVPIRKRMPDADPDLVAIIERAVAVDPERRHRSARQFERELGAFQASRELRVTHAAIADLVAATWDDVLAMRAEALGDAAGELEGRTLTLPADALEEGDEAEELEKVKAAFEKPTSAPPPSPPERWTRPKRPPRPAGWDKVTPAPDAPARQLDLEDRLARRWWLFGALLLAATLATFFGVRAWLS